MIGAGGHGKSVINVLWQAGYRVEAVIDTSADKWGRTLLDVPIVAPDSTIAASSGIGAVIAVGSNTDRKAMARRFSHMRWITAISPAATVYPSANISEGCVVLPGAVVGADVVIGKHGIVIAQAVVAHDCKVGDFVHIALGALIGGGVSVGEGAFLAIGSRVVPNLSIGPWALLGAGATAMRDIPAGGKAYGPPARLMGQEGG